MIAIRNLFLGLLFVSLCSFLPGDECSVYAPMAEGNESELAHFSAKGKPEGSTKAKVLSVNKSGTGVSIEMRSEAFDKKGKPTGTANYFLTCENGTFLVDMRTMVPQAQQEGFKDMQVTVEADKLDIPSNPTAGQSLRNGSVKMTASQEGSPITMKLGMTVSNRKVAAIEDVSVPAGTFKCVKVTYDAEIKYLFTIRMKMAEWYSKEVGLVRSETYNSKDKLESYTVLNSIKK